MNNDISSDSENNPQANNETPNNQEAKVTEENTPPEPVVSEQQSTTAQEQSTQGKQWKERLLSADHWLRFVFMVLFAIISYLACYVIVVLVLLQFVWSLIAGKGNGKLRDLGSSLSRYMYQILRFLTYNTEDKPFPFSDWPESESKNPQQDN